MPCSSAKVLRELLDVIAGLCISVVRFKVGSKAPKLRLVACYMQRSLVPEQCINLGRCIASFRCVKTLSADVDGRSVQSAGESRGLVGGPGVRAAERALPAWNAFALLPARGAVTSS